MTLLWRCKKGCLTWKRKLVNKCFCIFDLLLSFLFLMFSPFFTNFYNSSLKRPRNSTYSVHFSKTRCYSFIIFMKTLKCVIYKIKQSKVIRDCTHLSWWAKKLFGSSKGYCRRITFSIHILLHSTVEQIIYRLEKSCLRFICYHCSFCWKNYV